MDETYMCLLAILHTAHVSNPEDVILNCDKTIIRLNINNVTSEEETRGETVKLSLLLFLFMTTSSTWTVANLFKQLNERLLVSMSQSHGTQRGERTKQITQHSS